MSRTQCSTLYLVVFLLLFSVLPSFIVSASGTETDLTVTVSSSVAELAGAGTANITIALTASKDLTEVSVSGPGLNGATTPESMAAGGSKSIPIANLPITEAMLGQPIVYTVNYKVAGNVKSSSYNTVIRKRGGQPKLLLTVTSDKKAVEPGETVTFTYTIQNLSTPDNVVIENIVINDPIFSDVVFRQESLGVGENKKTSKTLKVNEAVTSKATATATSGGSAVNTAAAEIAIAVSEARLEISATADRSEVEQGETVNFTGTVKNTSGIVLRSIRILSHSGTEIKSIDSLNPSASSNFTYATSISESGSHSFIVEFTTNTGIKTSTSEPVGINMVGSFVIEVTPMVAGTAYTIPGDVPMNFSITTRGKVNLKDVTIRENLLGQIAAVGEIAAGATVNKEAVVSVAEAGNFTFVVEGVDATSEARYASSPIPISITVPVASQPPETASPNPGSDGLGTFFTVLMIIVGLIVAAAVVLGVLMILEKKKQADRASNRRPPGGGGPPSGGGRPVGTNGRPNRESRGTPRPNLPLPRDPRDPRYGEDMDATRRIARVVPDEELRPSPDPLTVRTNPFTDGGTVVEDDGVRVYRPARPSRGAIDRNRNNNENPWNDPDLEARLLAARQRRLEGFLPGEEPEPVPPRVNYDPLPDEGTVPVYEEDFPIPPSSSQWEGEEEEYYDVYEERFSEDDPQSSDSYGKEELDQSIPSDPPPRQEEFVYAPRKRNRRRN